MTTRTRVVAVLLPLCGAVLVLAGCTPVAGSSARADSSAGHSSPAQSSASSALPASAPAGAPATSAPASATGGTGTAAAALARIPVKGRAPLTGYARTDFGQAWADTDHNGCDTRDDVLARDLSATSTRAGTHGCTVLSGTLHEPYGGRTIHFERGVTTSAAVQIDHVVALGDAWQTGAQQWTLARRTDFANDRLELLAVDGPLNEAKGDGDAATWLPPNRAFRCAYVARQVAVKAVYGLWMTRAEHDAVARVLATCPGQGLPSATAPASEGLRGASTTSTPAAGALPASAPSTSAPATSARTASPAPAAAAGSAPAGAKAQCRDGSWSTSAHRVGTCAGHGGVAHWL